jgi:release factor glutamine methyltransferase
MTDEERLLKETYHGEKTEGFFADVERLQKGEPLAYIIGHIPFLDCTIWLDSRPLIPRPETEFWVEKAIEDIKSAGPSSPRLLDLCAGSGCIGVAAAKAISSAHVTFGELKREHLGTIANNLNQNGIACERYQIFQSDLFENITGTFDYILSNPPYIDLALNRAESSVIDYEPHEALYGGKDGIELIHKILEKTHDYLNPAGKLYLEHEPEQAKDIQDYSAKHGLVALTHTDQYGIARYSVIGVAK